MSRIEKTSQKQLNSISKLQSKLLATNKLMVKNKAQQLHDRVDNHGGSNDYAEAEQSPGRSIVKRSDNQVGFTKRVKILESQEGIQSAMSRTGATLHGPALKPVSVFGAGGSSS